MFHKVIKQRGSLEEKRKDMNILCVRAFKIEYNEVTILSNMSNFIEKNWVRQIQFELIE